MESLGTGQRAARPVSRHLAMTLFSHSYERRHLRQLTAQTTGACLSVGKPNRPLVPSLPFLSGTAPGPDLPSGYCVKPRKAGPPE